MCQLSTPPSHTHTHHRRNTKQPASEIRLFIASATGLLCFEIQEIWRICFVLFCFERGWPEAALGEWVDRAVQVQNSGQWHLGDEGQYQASKSRGNNACGSALSHASTRIRPAMGFGLLWGPGSALLVGGSALSLFSPPQSERQLPSTCLLCIFLSKPSELESLFAGVLWPVQVRGT